MNLSVRAGLGLFLSLECEIPGVDATSINGRALLPELEALTSLAHSQAVPPLSRFVRAHMSELSGFADDGCGSQLGERWFEPGEGLATVRALLQAWGAHRSPKVREDLETLEHALAEATRQGVAFHLFVD